MYTNDDMYAIFDEDADTLQRQDEGNDINEENLLIADFTNVLWSIIKNSVDDITEFKQLPKELEISEITQEWDDQTYIYLSNIYNIEPSREKLDLIQLKLVTATSDVEKMTYRLKNHINVQFNLDGSGVSDKTLQDLRVKYSPMILLNYPKPDSNGKEFIQDVMVCIPISNNDYGGVTRVLFDKKEEIVAKIINDYKEIFDGKLVNDRFIVLIEDINLKISPPVNIRYHYIGNLANRPIQMDESAGLLSVCLSIRFINESQLRPDGIEAKNAETRFSKWL